MDRKIVQDATFPKCPIRNILSHISEKWTFLVLYTLENNGKMRFNDIYRCIPDISQKMLAATLRTLKEDGIISRTIYPEVPPKVEYELTDRGLSLLPHIDSLIGWAIKNFDDILADRKQPNSAALHQHPFRAVVLWSVSEWPS